MGCHSCYVPASNASQALRRRHLQDCGLADASSPAAPGRYTIDQQKMQVRGAACALKHPLLPADVRAAKEVILRQFLQKETDEPLEEFDIQHAQQLDVKVPVKGYQAPEVRCATQLG